MRRKWRIAKIKYFILTLSRRGGAGGGEEEEEEKKKKNVTSVQSARPFPSMHAHPATQPLAVLPMVPTSGLHILIPVFTTDLAQDRNPACFLSLYKERTDGRVRKASRSAERE